MDINCTTKCVHQRDGKCKLNSLSAVNIKSDANCIYFENVNSDKKPSK